MARPNVKVTSPNAPVLSVVRRMRPARGQAKRLAGVRNLVTCTDRGCQPFATIRWRKGQRAMTQPLQPATTKSLAGCDARDADGRVGHGAHVLRELGCGRARHAPTSSGRCRPQPDK